MARFYMQDGVVFVELPPSPSFPDQTETVTRPATDADKQAFPKTFKADLPEEFAKFKAGQAG